MADDGAKKMTFFSKTQSECPLCETKFYKEDLVTGGGRMIAGDLTRDLRRLYEPSKKHGEVFPLIYTILVCPNCLYAAFPSDFFSPPDKGREALIEDTEKRAKSILPVFDDLDYSEPRTLKEGAASYFFAIMCYDRFLKDASPTIKQGMCALRAAWIFNDLHRKHSNENYDYLAMNFYRKARFFYSQAVEREQSGKETMTGAKYLGPDLDKNYGYDGVLYLNGLFEFLYGPKENSEKRIAALTSAKRFVAKIFGMGRASKNKPSILLDRTRDLYSEINKELESSGVAVTEEGDE
jgi:uncharacterized protein (DUF2225 family)